MYIPSSQQFHNNPFFDKTSTCKMHFNSYVLDWSFETVGIETNDWQRTQKMLARDPVQPRLPQ